MQTALIAFVIAFALAAGTATWLVVRCVKMPGRSYSGRLPPMTSEELGIRSHLERHVYKLAGEIGGRSMERYHGLSAAADHIRSQLHELERGTCLSPSQVRTFLECQARWYFKYVQRLPDTRNAMLALGSAVHRAIAVNLEQKVSTFRDLPVEDLLPIYHLAWLEESEGATLDEDDNPLELQRLGDVLIRKYMDEAAPQIQPAAVELKVDGLIAGVRVQGRIDALDTDGRIVDVKTSKKSPNGISADYKLQVTSYSLLEPRAKAARIDTRVKAKTVKLVSHSFDVSAADIAYAENIYPLAQEGMRGGLYLPNRNSNLCSKRHCPFWEACEAEYGGEVAA